MSEERIAMRKIKFISPVLILLVGFVFAFSTAARADDDPPGRVARLNYIQGSISFQPSGETDWVEANPNRPLTTGDNLWTDKNSRGELHVGGSSIRVAGETGITFLNLDDRIVQIQLSQGSMNVNVRQLGEGDAFEIDTPNLAFTLQGPGEYRVDVNPDGNATVVTVRRGEGQATGGGSEYHMESGERTTFTGTDSLNYDRDRASGLDEFDRWSRSRDFREERSVSARYVSRDVIGYEDLDEHGEWRDAPGYGHVWFPSDVSEGWAPYRNGHWAWVAPWGWTWIEDEPWGFAPFHYGRWVMVRDAWGWVPGPLVERPVYAPALVVFVGGPRFGLSVSFGGGGGGGGVAWFPLGPREVYVPSYHTSERYVQNVNITNTTVNVVNVTNVYNNVNVTKVTYMHQNNVAAVTAVSHDTFVNARPVRDSQVRVDEREMRNAEVQRNFTVAPERKSVVGASPAATVKPPEEMMHRQVFTKETPAPSRAPIEGGPQRSQSYKQGGAPAQQQQPRPTQPQEQQPAQRQPEVRQQPPQQIQPQQQQPRPTQPQEQQPAQRQPEIKQQPQQIQPQQQQPRPTQPQEQQPAQRQPEIKQQPQQQTQPQIQQHPTQQQEPLQQSRPPVNQTNKPPVQQPPAAKVAPPARSNEEVHPAHPSEKPQAAAPAPKGKEQPKAQEQGKDSKKQEDKDKSEKDKKDQK